MTYLRSLCILALGAFVFVGCDSDDNDNGDNIIDRVTITEVTVLDFPCDDNGDDWDGGLANPNPDIFYILFDDDTGNELDSTENEEFSNVECGDVITWDGNYTSRDLDRPLAIELYDKDDVNEDDFMGSTRVFDLDEAFDQPSLTISGDNDVQVRLRLEWD